MNPFYRIYSTLAVLVMFALLPLAASAQVCPASAGPTTVVDLDECWTLDEGVEVWQGNPVKGGTGLFNPFLTVNASNKDIIQGVNGLPPYPAGYDEQTTGGGAGRTTPLKMSFISYFQEQGGDETLFRVFFLDINQNGAGSDWYPLNDINVYVSDSPDLAQCYEGADDGFDATCVSGLGADQPVEIYDLNGRDLLLDYDFESGSGDPDLTLRVPDERFDDTGFDYCRYGDPDCQTYVYMYSRFGDTGIVDGCGTTYVCEDNDGGFEEWATYLDALINVTKTAEGNLGQWFDWTIDKTANYDNADNPCIAFAGDTCPVDYDVQVTQITETREFSISGQITLTVPNVFPGTNNQMPDVLVTDVSDLFEETDIVVTGCATPFTVYAGGATVVCDYEAFFDIYDEGLEQFTIDFLGDGITPDVGPNIASATIQTETEDGFMYTTYVSDPMPVIFDLANPYPIEGSQAMVDVEDTNGESWSDVSGTELLEYTIPFECPLEGYDETGYYEIIQPNTATIVDFGSDDHDVRVECYRPLIEKTASTTWTRYYTWDIDKVADPDELHVFIGAEKSSDYDVTVTKTLLPENEIFTVLGDITVINNAPIPMTVSLADVVQGVDADLDCELPIVLAADGGDFVCDYSAEVPEKIDGTNTATVTILDTDNDNAPLASFDGTADFVFPDEPNELNGTVFADDTNESWVGDPNEGEDGLWTATSDWTVVPEEFLFEYSHAFGCSAEDKDLYVEGVLLVDPFENTATVFDADTEYGSDDASVTLTCYAPVVSKDAETSYDRSWDWTIVKTAADQIPEQVGAELYDDAILAPISLQGANQAFLVTYTLQVSGVAEEFNEQVWGDISVYNPHPYDVMSVTVADEVPDAVGDVALDCAGALDIDPVTTEMCGYAADLPNATDSRTNSATVTLNDVDFDATAPIVFGAPANEYDRCVEVSDLAGPLGLEVETVVDPAFCGLTEGHGPVGDGYEADTEYSYDVQFGGSDPGDGTTWIELEDCVPYEHPNTASLTGDDAGVSSTSSWWIVFDVGCPGCTLTQGYWKTHNPTFRGGAPEDLTWTLLFFEDPPCDPEDPTVAECIWDQDELFMSSALSYFETMWTPPKQGNPYFRLAHQFIASQLNVLAGAYTPDDVDDALAEAEILLGEYSSNPQKLIIKGKAAKDPNPTQQEILDDGERMGYLAGLFAAFNEGSEFTTDEGTYYDVLGPGHCDEDGTEQPTATSLVNVAGSVEAAIELETSRVSETGSDVQADVDKVDEVAVDGTTEVQATEIANTENKGDNELARLKAGDEEEITETGSQSEMDSPAAAAIEIPSEFAVGNYPNPFNPTTTIQVALPEASHVRVAVYDLLGRMVTLLVDGQLSAGTHSVTFDAGQLPSGVYLYRFEYSGGAVTRTMQLLK